MTKLLSCGLALALGLAMTAAGADQTWTGKISDSDCGATHKAAAEHGKKMSARDCTLACIKNGAKYVFVTNGKVYNIQNQDFATLEQNAGHTVRLTGEMSGDTITVSKIAMPHHKAKSETTS